MKTSELIAILSNRLATHGDLEVQGTWEGQDKAIEATNVYRYGDSIFIDCDANFYKPRDNHEGEDGT